MMNTYRSMLSLRVLGSSSLVVVLACTALASAQTTLDFPVGEITTYRIDSGSFDNPTDDYKIVYSKTVAIENAAWLRLYFGDFELDKSSYIRTTSNCDGEVQELDFADAAMWGFTTAYFNGNEVLLELIAAPHTQRNRVVVERLGVDFIPTEGDRGLCAHNDCGICHPDSRVLSYETWAGRLWPYGCTASVYNTHSCLVSAGHCSGSNTVILFNVPISDPDCSTNVPPVADQFPVTGRLYQNGGVGADWAVMTTGTNNLGQTIYQRYGEFRPIATTAGNTGDPIAVWGYGVSNAHPTHSQVQQYSTGSISARYSTYYRAWCDITYGNSGSALVKDNEIIGIVTHCPGHGQCNNYMTRADLSAFVNARNQLCPEQPGACCFAGGTCERLTETNCVTAGGDWQGMDTVCDPNPCFLPGDLNCDGVIDAFDIQLFVLALTDPDGYAAQYPDCNIMNADVNGDGVVDGFDIQPFVELLVGG